MYLYVYILLQFAIKFDSIWNKSNKALKVL